MTDPTAPPPLPATAVVTTEVSTAPGSGLGPIISMVAVALGGLVLLGAVIAVARDDLGAYFMRGPVDWWSRFSAFTIQIETAAAFTAIAALILDRSGTRVLAVLGLAGFVAAKVITSVHQMRLFEQLG